MSKHTPGPWEARWNTMKYAGREPINHCVIGTPRRNEYGSTFVTARIEGPFPLGIEQAKANARLIAASPDLLDALIECVARHGLFPEQIEAGIVQPPWEKKARAAIKKATGE